MELLQTWQILDWLSIQASGLMMDGMFLCGTFFVWNFLCVSIFTMEIL